MARWAAGIERVHECIAGRFRRPEPRRRALDYLRGLLSPVERGLRLFQPLLSLRNLSDHRNFDKGSVNMTLAWGIDLKNPSAWMKRVV